MSPPLLRGCARALVGIAFATAGFGGVESGHPESRELGLEWFWEAVRTADRMDVLEGLPHPWQKEMREAEIAKQPTIVIAGEHFYPELLDLAAEQREAVGTRVLARETFVIPRAGERPSVKLCGGFHADFGLQWRREGRPVAWLLICFGCGEIKAVHPNGTWIASDQTGPGERFFRETIGPLRKSRPLARRQETPIKTATAARRPLVEVPLEIPSPIIVPPAAWPPPKPDTGR